MSHSNTLVSQSDRSVTKPATQPQSHSWDADFSRHSRWALAAVTAAALAAASMLSQAHAAPGSSAPAQPAAVVAAAETPASSYRPVLTIKDVYERLESQGYTDIREIEWEHGHYEIKARASDGSAVKIHMDGHSGAVMSLRKRGHFH